MKARSLEIVDALREVLVGQLFDCERLRSSRLVAAKRPPFWPYKRATRREPRVSALNGIRNEKRACRSHAGR